MPLLTLTRADFPGIDPADVGSIARRGYGTVEDVRIHCIVSGMTARLAAAMSAAATSITVDDASLYPAAPFTAQIGGEIMTVGAKSGNTLSSITRGINGTTALPHAAGRTVWEVRTEYVYLVSDQAVKAINAVLVDGERQTSGFTAYTGQAGDAHASYAGKAVIAFSADPFVAPQRNLADAGTETITPLPTLCTDDGLGTTIAKLGGTLNQVVTAGAGRSDFWLSWPADCGSGAILADSVTLVLSETAAGSVPARLLVSSRDTATGNTIKVETVYLDADASSRSVVIQLGTVWGVQLSIVAQTGTATIVSATRSTTRAAFPSAEPTTTYTDRPLLASDERLGSSAADTGIPLAAASSPAWATFDPTDRGTVVAQYAYGSLYSAAGGVVWLLGINGETLVSREKITVPAGGVSGLLGTIAGGGWATHLAVVLETGTVALEYLTRVTTVLAATASDGSAMTSARAVIGDRVTVDADWHYDTDGTYGGSGNLIERPDWVIKHFVRNYMGATTGEIDGTSFTAAGALYASAITGGYKFGWIVPKIDGWEALKQLGFCSRSTVRFLAGKYYLNYTPDTAPASVATLTRDDLAGAGARYVYTRDSVRMIFNDLTALYQPNYSGDTSREISSGHLASATATDAASVTKYGTYSTTYLLPCVRSATMAAHVLAHHLLETALPLLTVQFSGFWQRGDLQVGNTITITDDIYTGKKWWIEALTRPTKTRVQVTGREWWT